VNEEALAHWRAVAPQQTNKQTNKHILKTIYIAHKYMRQQSTGVK